MTLTVAALAPFLASGIFFASVVPLYLHQVRAAKEAVLEEDRDTTRKAVESYTIDQGKHSESLDDLVRAGYLKSVPRNPMAPEKEWDTW